MGLRNDLQARCETDDGAVQKSVLHDFLDSEGKTLLTGDDGHYYTAEDKIGPYGDYAWTEWVEYGRFESPEKVRALLAT